MYSNYWQEPLYKFWDRFDKRNTYFIFYFFNDLIIAIILGIYGIYGIYALKSSKIKISTQFFFCSLILFLWICVQNFTSIRQRKKYLYFCLCYFTAGCIFLNNIFLKFISYLFNVFYHSAKFQPHMMSESMIFGWWCNPPAPGFQRPEIPQAVQG